MRFTIYFQRTKYQKNQFDTFSAMLYFILAARKWDILSGINDIFNMITCTFHNIRFNNYIAHNSFVCLHNLKLNYSEKQWSFL